MSDNNMNTTQIQEDCLIGTTSLGSIIGSTIGSTIGSNLINPRISTNYNYTYTNRTASSAYAQGLTVSSDADFHGDVKIKGVSIVESIEKINQRLAILVPDPAKLAHFEALKRAHDAYKTLEALCEIPTKDE